ncbi:iron chelate uptake ABC transporter family permease subunit [Corynebacterium bovis]|uniref:FecCD family ABC transporter permease n=1 Tax=Corynebacterium bovis TaxID=36808 RepID=UPI00244C2145|nr:iron chelate uptake ABC transporter family permease subunit [Corynebacterium bovis]MDH2455046.1 iron chelate uptake ABC transporter family permease subunit [Corynebacterium bovis]
MSPTAATAHPPRRTRRTRVVTACLLAALVVLAVTGLLLGDYPLTPPRAVAALLGLGDDRLAVFFVQQQRAPRVVAGAVVGAALGASGAIIQSLSRNPLGSPDIIGFTVGSATGALLAITVLGTTPTGTAAGAVVGGAAAAVLITALGWRSGVTGPRLVLVGIGVSAVLHALNSLLLVRASLTAAQTAALWLAGSLAAVTWATAAGALVAVGVLLAVAWTQERTLNALALGDELATGLGVRVERRRLGLVALGVALVALAVAVAGPVAFVALAAPHSARLLTRTGGAGVVTSMILGAVLVVGSDIVAQRIFAPVQLPVGVVTGVLGGVYLLYLLTRQRHT